VSLSERNPYEVCAEYVQRLEDLEEAVRNLRASIDALIMMLEEQRG
jgi:hypothetical protein